LAGADCQSLPPHLIIRAFFLGQFYEKPIPSDKSIDPMKMPIDKVHEISMGYNLAHNLEKIFPNSSIGRELMRKRNKKTTIISKLELSGLTEHILGSMGEEGKHLRDRLVRFFEERTISNQNVLGKAGADRSVDIT
jgi:hypothetical protein